MHPFKKGRHILARCVTKGRRGPLEYSREKMSDRITPDSFFSDTHAFVAPQPVRFFLLSSSSYSRVSYYKMYSIYSFRTHKKTFQSECFFERVFRPLLVTQLFHEEEKKREKIFSLFFVQKQAKKTLF